MQRLMDQFATLFDLDHRVGGVRLGDLIGQAIGRIEERALPDWGSPGPAGHYESEGGTALDFHYLPHLFPGMELDLRLAHQLQFHMLPREVPPGAPVSIAAVLESYCHLSGDLFGWEILADGQFLIWIVDLSGHGVQAGLASAVLKVLIDNLRQRSRVGSLAAELNEIFIRCLRADKGNLFATGFFLALSPEGVGSYTSAGHPPLLWRRRDGRIEELPSTGLPIGMFPGLSYPARTVRLEPGDTLLFYTDGVVETMNDRDEPFGFDRLRAFLAAQSDTSPRPLTERLYRTIAAHQDMARLDDDVTFVAARVTLDGSGGRGEQPALPPPVP